MEQNNEQFQRGQQGSGSAENIGQDREKQFNQKADISNEEKQDIEAQLGKGAVPVADIKDLGGLSGADDSAGGFGDGMTQENTGKPTDR